MQLAGDLIGWSVAQGVALRTDSPPVWAAAETRGCAVVPIPAREDTAALTVEFTDARALPQPADLERAAAYLAAFLDLEAERASSIEHRARLDALMDALRRLPVEIEPAALARRMAHSAIELTNAAGACVVGWDGERGRVLAVGGEAAVEVGAVVQPQESETALAARAGSTIHREGRKRIPIVAAVERFGAHPRTFVAIPLTASGVTLAVVTLWTPSEQLNSDGVALLGALAPFAALQFRHAQTYDQLRERADRDRLTGLLNRQAFDTQIGAEVARYQRYQRPFALLMLDLDHFKAVNDHYGHQVGDAVLAAIGHTLTAALREVDVPARYGGEEFAIILPETDLKTALEIAERVRAAIASAVVATTAGQLRITVSIGVAACPDLATDVDGLIRFADHALYASKHSGRNRVTAAAS